jgi:hypothetical protein
MLQNSSQYRSQSIIWHILRSPVAWLGVLIVLTATAYIMGTRWVAQATAPAPADLFMQSVVKRDGNLGWHQLCPDLQAQEPLPVLAKQVEQQRIAESGQGLTLTVDYIGADSRPQGGQIRLYVVTAHRPHGWVQQRTYSVYTQASGCVENVTNS